MSLEIIKPLLESGIVNEETAQAINEAWEVKLNEAREQVRSELREEFAGKYEHDKNIMVEALDKMITEGLTSEIAEFNEERQAMNEDRVKAKAKLKENAQKFNEFMVSKLAEEIKELRSDRQIQKESQAKLEKFVVKALAGEIREFEQDKRAVIEAKVKLVAEAKSQLQSLKTKFIRESASKVKSLVESHLRGEISQLKEDIKSASESTFGRRLFEAFAAEFSVSHMNEKAETRKLLSQLAESKHQLVESTKEIQKTQLLVESKEREVRMIKESNLRQRTLGELLGTLNEEKSQVMMSLLESVQTPKLKAAFDKYLPAVLNSGSEKPRVSVEKQRITESTAVTGDKSAKKTDDDVLERDNVIDIKRLAGL